MTEKKRPGGDIRRERETKKKQREHLREKLSNQGHIQHINQILSDMMSVEQIEAIQLQKNKVIIDTKLALIKKFLPDLKQVEITGADGDDIKTDNTFTIEVIGATATDS